MQMSTQSRPLTERLAPDYAAGMPAVHPRAAPCLLLALVALWATAIGARALPEEAVVPAEEYPIYDEIIRTKYLTDHTRLLLIERLTTIRLEPGGPPVTRAYLQQQRFFEGQISPALATDFVLKNTRPARLEPRFRLGVRYRLVTEEGEESKASAALAVSLGPAQAAPTTIGPLALSRVGFGDRGDRALVYVAEQRPDGTGGGLLVLLGLQPSGWRVLDTEVVWVAREETE